MKRNREPFIGKMHHTAPHYTPDHPDQPFDEGTAKGLAKDPYNNQLIIPPDSRPIAVKERAPVLRPTYNHLYDTNRTTQAWRYGADIEINAFGQLGPAGGATLQVPVAMPQAPNWRLEQWPGGTQLFLVLTDYAIGAEASVSGGPLTMKFQSLGGSVVNLGILGTGGLPINLSFDVVLQTPITDPSNPQLGNLIWTQQPGAASAATLDWMISFSVAYLLPDLDGYEVRHIGKGLDHA